MESSTSELQGEKCIDRLASPASSLVLGRGMEEQILLVGNGLADKL